MFLQVLITSILVFGADAEKVQPRKDSLKQIFEGCMKLIEKPAGEKKKICDCVVRNLNLRPNDYELEILAKQYTKPTDSLEGSELFNYDVDVADHCLVKPDWQAKPRETSSVGEKAPKKKK